MSYLDFLWRSKNEHRIHSPFVYELQMNIFKDGMYYYGFDYIAKYLETHPTTRKEKKKIRQLFRLVNHFNPSHTIEITDELSTFSLTLALPSKKNQVTFFSKGTGINESFPKNLKTKEHHELEEYLNTTPPLDFVFINTSENLEETLNKIRPFIHHDTCIVINKPYLQQDNWNNAIRSQTFNVSIDLYELGILFLKDTQNTEHFVLRT